MTAARRHAPPGGGSRGRTRGFFAELYRRNRLLTLIGWLHVLLALAALTGMLTDDREVLGVNVWTKPFRFMLSLTAYVWTIAWLSRYIARPRWAIRTLSVVIGTALVVESACLFLQAARAVPSHFNVATDFDAAVFRTMVLMIVTVAVATAVILLRFARPVVHLQPAYLWGIRFGLAIFLAGAAIGGLMVVRGSHTVGAGDGGPGVPFLDWSTVAGDLRIAHGLALHALQVLPVFGHLAGCWQALSHAAVRVAVVAAGALLYAGAVFLLYRQAMDGRPFL